MDEDKKNILVHGIPEGTIELRPHPEEIIDVDPEILAIMNARLRGESFEKMYGKEERVSNELLIRLEKGKLSKVFGSPTELSEAFSSLQNIKAIRQELVFESVNRELLAEHFLKISCGEPVDEFDGYASLLFGGDVQSKSARLNAWRRAAPSFQEDAKQVFGLLVEPYMSSHFDVLGVSKELLQIQKPLRDYLKGGKLLPAVDEILLAFYGRSACVTS